MHRMLRRVRASQLHLPPPMQDPQLPVLLPPQPLPAMPLRLFLPPAQHLHHHPRQRQRTQLLILHLGRRPGDLRVDQAEPGLRDVNLDKQRPAEDPAADPAVRLALTPPDPEQQLLVLSVSSQKLLFPALLRHLLQHHPLHQQGPLLPRLLRIHLLIG